MKNWSVLFFCFTWVLMHSQGDQCFNSESLKKEDSTKIRVVRLKCNSDQPDFSPVVLAGKMYFVSGRSTKAGVEYKDLNNRNDITDILEVKLVDSVRTGKAFPIKGGINSRFYEGPFCFSGDGEQVFFTGNDKNSSKLKIYRSIKTNSQWSKPEALSFCTDTFSYCHPSLSHKNDTLWFCSNLAGGAGGMDLFYSVYSNGQWQGPVNAGNTINTTAHELFPHITRNGDLYFASARPEGAGGLDLYEVKRGESVIVRRMPFPFNSGADDFGIWMDSTLQQGYFSSSRNSKSLDDIYYFSNAVPDFTGARTLTPRKTFCYTFYEEGTKEMRDTVTFEFEWDFGDGEKALGSEARHCFKNPGAYEVKLNIVQKWSGELFKNQTAYSLVIDTPATFFIDSPDFISVDSCLQLKYVVKGFGKYQIQNAYWEFGDERFNTGREVNHVYRKPGQYIVKVFLLARDIIENKTVKFIAEKKIVTSQ